MLIDFLLTYWASRYMFENLHSVLTCICFVGETETETRLNFQNVHYEYTYLLTIFVHQSPDFPQILRLS